MFFKRKNINPDFQERASSSSDSQDGGGSGESSHYLQDEEQVMQSADSEPRQGESVVDRKRREVEEREKAVDEARKQIEQELDTKHYYHQRLLETLDLGLLSTLDKERAKKDLHDAIVQLMADDQTKALSAEGRKRIIKQIEDESVWVRSTRAATKRCNCFGYFGEWAKKHFR